MTLIPMLIHTGYVVCLVGSPEGSKPYSLLTRGLAIFMVVQSIILAFMFSS